MDLTNDDVADILAVLDSLPYDELDLQTPRFRLTLRRAPSGGWTQESQILSEPTLLRPAPVDAAGAGVRDAAGVGVEGAPTGARAGADSGGGGAGADGGDAGCREGLVAVSAPLPGTFYRAPRPGAAPFVEVGDEVGADTVVAIVETMKLMNSVHAGTRGRVAQICLGNAEPAVQGAPLMWIAPA